LSESEEADKGTYKVALGRRGLLYTVFGGALAAIAGWIAGALAGDETFEQQESSLNIAENRISTLEAQVAALTERSTSLNVAENRISALETQVAALIKLPLASSEGLQQAQLEGERNERIIFNKSELSVINPDGVLLNLVATHGHVGIRFYKDFDFGNEQETGPWHMGFIEGVEGYQGLAILRDWQFTAALWDEDGKLILGRLHPHPPANDPAKARFQVRGTLDEVQTLVEASANQTADIFQVVGRDGTNHLAVDGAGNVHVGSHDEPKEVVLHDTVDGSAYALSVSNGSLSLTKT
jgi:hypothetical protein